MSDKKSLFTNVDFQDKTVALKIEEDFICQLQVSLDKYKSTIQDQFISFSVFSPKRVGKKDTRGLLTMNNYTLDSKSSKRIIVIPIKQSIFPINMDLELNNASLTISGGHYEQDHRGNSFKVTGRHYQEIQSIKIDDNTYQISIKNSKNGDFQDIVLSIKVIRFNE